MDGEIQGKKNLLQRAAKMVGGTQIVCKTPRRAVAWRLFWVRRYGIEALRPAGIDKYGLHPQKDGDGSIGMPKYQSIYVSSTLFPMNSSLPHATISWTLPRTYFGNKSMLQGLIAVHIGICHGQWCSWFQLRGMVILQGLTAQISFQVGCMFP